MKRPFLALALILSPTLLFAAPAFPPSFPVRASASAELSTPPEPSPGPMMTSMGSIDAATVATEPAPADVDDAASDTEEAAPAPADSESATPPPNELDAQ